jgi:hypothetical protein
VSITTRLRTALSVFIVAGGLISSVVPYVAHASDEIYSFVPREPAVAVHAIGPLVPRKPDVAVSVVGHSGDIVNDHLDVAFNLTDKYHDASVQLKSLCNYRDRHDPVATPRTEQKLTSMTLYASMQVPVPYLVTCVPRSTERVSSVVLVANVVNGDFNPNNNHDSWDPITGK